MRFFDKMSPSLNFRNCSPMSSPIKGGSCSATRRRFNALDYFVALHLVVRDQEVEGSNPFAPTTSFRISDLHYTKFRRAPGTKPRGLSKLDSNYASPNDIQSRRFGCGRTPASQAGVLSLVPVAGLLNDESSCRTGALPQDSQRTSRKI